MFMLYTLADNVVKQTVALRKVPQQNSPMPHRDARKLGQISV